jgi:Replication-relaxation
MALSVVITLTGNLILGLFFIQRYRFLTISQFARITQLHHVTAAEKLRAFEHMGLLGYFGNSRPGIHGKTPKAYFLTRKGFALLQEESDFSPEHLGRYVEVKVESRWSPQMYHRLATVDLLLSLEMALRNRPHLSLVKTLLEYKRVKKGNQIISETVDYVAAEESAETKIIPDAAFILENTTTSRRALFFLEMDMGSERIISASMANNQTTLARKFSQYDRYLKSFRYSKTYAEFGEFRAFTMLFVTLQEARIENIRNELSSLPQELARHYRLTTFPEAMGDFLGAVWHSRLLSDTTRHPLVRE